MRLSTREQLIHPERWITQPYVVRKSHRDPYAKLNYCKNQLLKFLADNIIPASFGHN